MKLEPSNRLVSDEASIVDIDKMLRGLWEGKWLILTTTSLFTAAAAYLAFSLPDQYSATSQLMVMPDRGEFVGIRALNSGAPPNEFLVESTAHMVRSTKILERVVTDLSLDTNDEFIGEVEPEANSNTELDERSLRIRLAMKALNEVLTVRPAGNSYTILIEATAENPFLSSDIANTVAAEFVAMEKETKIAEAQEANSWILERLDQMKERVLASSRALENFRIQTGNVTESQVTDLARFLNRLRGGATSNSTTAQMERVEEELREKSLQVTELLELERHANADRGLYERLLERARELQELETLQVSDTRVISDALAPLEKSGPPRKIIAILGAIFGIALGVGLVAMRQLFLRRDSADET